MSAPPHRAAEALSEADLERLQALLDALPAPLEPLDVSMADGYLCGVLLQPEAVPLERWLPPLLSSPSAPTHWVRPRHRCCRVQLAQGMHLPLSTVGCSWLN